MRTRGLGYWACDRQELRHRSAADLFDRPAVDARGGQLEASDGPLVHATLFIGRSGCQRTMAPKTPRVRGRRALRKSFVLNARAGERPSTGRLRAGRGAAQGVALGGMATLWGSVRAIGHLPGYRVRQGRRDRISGPRGQDGRGLRPQNRDRPCGLLLAIIGIAALRQAGVSPFRIHSVVLALAALLTVGAFVVRMYVLPEFCLYGSGSGHLPLWRLGPSCADLKCASAEGSVVEAGVRH